MAIRVYVLDLEQGEMEDGRETKRIYFSKSNKYIFSQKRYCKKIVAFLKCDYKI